ncbi:O-antigen ligase family protein [Scytonema hofmannii]|uniref:O-antigen ligase family protein n=1 Tax=Scytonema hofmannii TaxID=34078 RepID=UPI0003455250|nr:O-antigen ligase family protein [Scytonema hofmannii]
MNPNPIKPQNLPEALIWYYILFTYLIYLLGAQFLIAPILASFLAFCTFKKWCQQNENTPLEERVEISTIVWIWLIAVFIIEVALIVGQSNFDLGMGQILKSSLNWYRTWMLLVLFLIAGHLNIRPQLVYRSICILGFQTLIIVFVANIANLLHLPDFYYLSPLKIFGGVRTSYEVYLFYIFDDGERRMQLFAPWPPALGMIGNLYFFIALQENNKKWRLAGMAGSIAMIVVSVSRAGFLCLPLVLGVRWLLTNFLRPWVQLATGCVSTVATIAAPTLINLITTFKEDLSKARAGSSKVRETLQRMAIELWWNEAPIWGHGRLEESGPALVGKMPIGSHHTWFGILYAHGLVGCIALVLALISSFVYLLIQVRNHHLAMLGLSILITMIFFSFGENIDGFTYVYWPALLILGMAYGKSS